MSERSGPPARRPSISPDIVFQRGSVRRDERETRLGQRGTVVWFTGLPGSGKSSIARAVERRLADAGHLAYLVDGDNLRHGLCADLRFSAVDRKENVRRAAEVAALLGDAGLLALTAFISPFRKDRERARAIALGTLGPGRFIEVFVDTPPEVCEARDPKGHWAKARRGEVVEFTGVSSPYEAPTDPELTLRTTETDVDQAAARVVAHLAAEGLLAPPPGDGRSVAK